ncbi:MAG TPA: hypothetical protein VGK61_05100 [Planctomycetota bacterium]
MTGAAASVPAGIADSPRVPPRRTFLRDLRFGAIALILLAAVFAWYGWSGDVFTPLSFVALGIFFGLPVLLFALAVATFSDRPDFRIFRRATIQVMLVVVMSIPLVFVGLWAEGLSIRATQGRGDMIAAALEAYRTAQGTYPETLAALGEYTKVDLPRPTICSDFGYSRSMDGLVYSLSFKVGGVWSPWLRRPGSQVWSQDD